jgi:hypothetical protein
LAISKRVFIAAVVVGGSFAAFGFYIILAEAQLIFVPVFTPTTLSIDGVAASYPVNSSINYSVTVKGYGSNCLALKATITNEQSNSQVAFFRKADDCRYMTISYGAYNYTRSFSYQGNAVLGKAGDYLLHVEFTDEITGDKQVLDKTFKVL